MDDPAATADGHDVYGMHASILHNMQAGSKWVSLVMAMREREHQLYFAYGLFRLRRKRTTHTEFPARSDPPRRKRSARCGATGYGGCESAKPLGAPMSIIPI